MELADTRERGTKRIENKTTTHSSTRVPITKKYYEILSPVSVSRSDGPTCYAWTRVDRVNYSRIILCRNADDDLADKRGAISVIGKEKKKRRTDKRENSVVMIWYKFHSVTLINCCPKRASDRGVMIIIISVIIITCERHQITTTTTTTVMITVVMLLTRRAKEKKSAGKGC